MPSEVRCAKYIRYLINECFEEFQDATDIESEAFAALNGKTMLLTI